MRAGGDSRFRRHPAHIRQPSRSTYPMLFTFSIVFMSPGGSPKDSPWCGGNCNAVPPISGPQRWSRTCSETCFTLLRRADHLTEAHQAHLDRLFDAHPRLRTAWDALQELYQIYEADDLDAANEALGRFADLYATGQIPEYRDIVDTIIAWGEEILAYHSSRRASNGPIEGINNLLQVLRRVAHGFTNPDNYAARGVLVT